MNVEYFQQILAQGENISVEFKECKTALNKDVYETACAFLNRAGGEILLGVKTNLIESYERLMAFIAKHLPDQFYQDESANRISLRDKIFREVVANILIHREYSNPYPAKIIIERNQVVAENSNRPHFHGVINPANFSPFPKNPIISAFFREIGRAEELGSGVRNLFRYTKAYSGGNEPSLIEEDIFKIIVPIDERLIVDVATPQATPQATTKEEIILEFCKTPRSREEIQLYICIMDRKYFRENILKPLLASGKILQTIPDKPTSPKQKYYAANSS